MEDKGIMTGDSRDPVQMSWVVIIGALIIACDSKPTSEFAGMWLITGDEPGYILWSPDSLVAVTESGGYEFAEWRTLDDGSLAFTSEEGTYIGRVPLHTADRIDLDIDGEMLSLIRESVESGSIADYVVSGEVGPREALVAADSLSEVTTPEDSARIVSNLGK